MGILGSVRGTKERHELAEHHARCAPHLVSGHVKMRIFNQDAIADSFVMAATRGIEQLAQWSFDEIGNFARVTGAYFFSAVIAKEQKLDIEKDFQNVPAETGALIALLERGEVEAINMFEPHTTRLVMSGKYRVLADFDIELENIFGAPPLKSTVGMLKETVEKQPALVKAIRSAYGDAIRVIKAGQDEEFFKAKAKELFNLSTPEEITAGLKQNKANFADKWGENFFQSQNKILQSGISLGLLPNIGDLNNLWIK